MKRSFYLFPLMAATALSLSLAACDDNKTEDQAAGTSTESTMAPSDTTATADAPAGSTMTPATTTDTQASQVAATSATAYSTSEGATTGAVFMTLQNSGTQATKLTGGSTDVAGAVELHESVMDPSSGAMQMRKVDGIDIQPGQSVELKPDGYHVMLTGLNKTLVEGETFNLTLRFDNGPEVTVPVMITAAGGNASAGTMSDSTSATGAAGTMPSDSSAMPTTDGTTTDGGEAGTTSGMDAGTGTPGSSTTSPGMGGSATGTSGMGTGTSANPAATEADSATGQ